MAISFNNIPANWQVPLFWLEVDPSMAGLPTLAYPALLVGYKTNGSFEPNVPVPISSVEQARAGGGDGSMLHMMAAAFFANNLVHQLHVLPLTPPDSGTQASGTITVAGAPTGSGYIVIYVAGMPTRVPVTGGQTVNQVATAIAAALTANTALPVTAAASSAVVTLTCKFKGESGNDIRFEHNVLGEAGGELVPAGLILTYSGDNFLASGTGTPDWSGALAGLADDDYQFVAMPFTDTGSLGVWNTEYGFGDGGRWGWLRQLYGTVFNARRGLYADLITFGAAQNAAASSILAVERTSPSPVWCWTAAYTAKAARALVNHPARPLQTLELDAILSARRGLRFAAGERNNIAGNGLATQRHGPNGVPQIEVDRTTYQRNSYGVSDDAYAHVTTLATLAEVFRSLRHRITNRFPRHMLADDGTPFGAGTPIVTPKVVKAELIAHYQELASRALVENSTAFAEHLIVERDLVNVNRLNVLYPPDLVNQLRIFAVQAQFRLQYGRGGDLAAI